MTLNDLIEKIKEFEGFVPCAYYDLGGNKGTKTIGYGFTDKKSLSYKTMTRETADKILTEKVINTYEQVCIYLDRMGYYNVSNTTLYALTDFAYNLGMGNLKKLIKPTITRPKRTHEEIKKAIPLYCKAGGKTLKGLQKRRDWEVSIYGD